MADVVTSVAVRPLIPRCEYADATSPQELERVAQAWAAAEPAQFAQPNPDDFYAAYAPDPRRSTCRCSWSPVSTTSATGFNRRAADEPSCRSGKVTL